MEGTEWGPREVSQRSEILQKETCLDSGFLCDTSESGSFPPTGVGSHTPCLRVSAETKSNSFAALSFLWKTL